MESVIQRSKLVLGVSGVSEEETYQILIKEGVSPELAFLAVQAGKILAKDEEKAYEQAV